MERTIRKPLVIGIGEVLWDMLPTGRRLGGAPLNFAWHAKQQGAQTFAVSAIGSDSNGRNILAELENKGLSAELVFTVDGHPTGTVSVKLDDGIPNYTIHTSVAWDYTPYEDKLADFARQADAVCFGTLAQRNKVSAQTINRFLSLTRPDCLKVFDVNLRQNFYTRKVVENSLYQCNILKVNDEELPILADFLQINGEEKSLMVALAKRYELRKIIYTKGKVGSILYTDGNFIPVPAYRYGATVDTVGCGDSFTATLVTGLLLGQAPEDAMWNASRIAGIVCASEGAMPEILEFDNKREC